MHDVIFGIIEKKEKRYFVALRIYIRNYQKLEKGELFKISKDKLKMEKYVSKCSQVKWRFPIIPYIFKPKKLLTN